MKDKKQYTTQELVEKYEVIGFGYGHVAVMDRKTGQEGSFNFGGHPRMYFDFKPHNDD
jgi:hypothetical protein